MAQTGSVIEAARAIRYFLPSLPGLARPDEVDHRLVVLLRKAQDGTDVESGIVDVLMAQPPTCDWAAEFVDTGLPPGFPHATKGYSQLPGQGAPVRAPRYACPVDELYVWYRRTVQQEIPYCRDHPEQRLVLSS
jgi:hypothetical protein